MSRTPWIGLAALIGMFVLPFLPNWLFEGPRTIKHRPPRHVCGECGEPWTAGHTCPPTAEIRQPLRGELRRLHPRGEIVTRTPPAPTDRPADQRRGRSRRRLRRFEPPL